MAREQQYQNKIGDEIGIFPCQLEHVRTLVFGLEVGDDVRASRGRERKIKK
jgi:hypothetical protein